MNQEVREWIVLYGQACNAKYRKEMNEAFILIEDLEKRLTRDIKELEDIRLVMIAVKDLRENEIRIDMSIGPIEESYTMLQAHGINIAREEIERADTLRYRWGKLQARCVRTDRNSSILLKIFVLFLLVGSHFTFIGYSTNETSRIITKYQTIHSRMSSILHGLRERWTYFTQFNTT